MSDIIARLLTDAIKLFGRVHSFDLECPRCGQVLMARSTGTSVQASDALPAHVARPTPRPKGAPRLEPGRRAELPWNPITGRFRCTNCQRVYATGLLVWEVTGPDRGLAPEDHVPDAGQRDQLRDLIDAGRAERLGAVKIPRQFARQSGDRTNLRG